MPGDILIPAPGTSYLDSIVKRVRRSVRDYPDETLSTEAMNTAIEYIVPPEADRGKFDVPGIKFEWDDETGEMGVTTGAPDADGKVPVRRARFGTGEADHGAGVTILIDPRFSFLRVADAINEVIEGDLWPHVWVPGEKLLAWEATDTFDPDVADIMEVNFVFQLNNGLRYKINDFRFTPSDAIADEAWPNGILTLPRSALIGSVDFFIAYKAKPTLFNLTPSLIGLVALGARASMMLDEEIEHVAPGRAAIRDRVQEGAKSNAGRTLRAQFLDRRDTERAVLLNQLAEQGTRFRGH